MLCSPVLAQGVCDRTPQVRDALMDAAAVSNCAQVTPRHLSQVSLLNLETSGITTLKSRDFSGLSSVLDIWLRNNSLSEITGGTPQWAELPKSAVIGQEFPDDFTQGDFHWAQQFDLPGFSWQLLDQLIGRGLQRVEFPGVPWPGIEFP